MKFLNALTWMDWLALAWFLLCWLGYVGFAKRTSTYQRRATLLAATNHYRQLWMMQATLRDQRTMDAIITQNLSTSPSFFASTTILIIGGLLAMLGTEGKVAEVAAEIPFVQASSVLVLDIKLALMLAIFVFAFFRFSWAMRQYTFAALVIGAIPPREAIKDNLAVRVSFAQKASKVLGLAAETFNAGVRAYYFSFAALCWFFSPLAFALATLAVLAVLYAREFKSDVLQELRDVPQTE